MNELPPPAVEAPGRPGRRTEVVALTVLVAALVVTVGYGWWVSPSIERAPVPGAPPAAPPRVLAYAINATLTPNRTVPEGDVELGWNASAAAQHPTSFTLSWTASVPALVCLAYAGEALNFSGCQRTTDSATSFVVRHGVWTLALPPNSTPVYSGVSASFVEAGLPPNASDDPFGSYWVNGTSGNLFGLSGPFVRVTSQPVPPTWASAPIFLPASSEMRFDAFVNFSGLSGPSTVSVMTSYAWCWGPGGPAGGPAYPTSPQWSCAGAYLTSPALTISVRTSSTTTLGLSVQVIVW